LHHYYFLAGESKMCKKKPGRNTQAKSTLDISYRSLASIKLHERNPRLHSQKQVRQIAKSIESFGFKVPILLDRDFRVVAGHGRLLAAQLLGLTEVPRFFSNTLQKRKPKRSSLPTTS
jgi:ParB-like nuclease domain